jgi:predicted membrane protein
MERQDSTNTNFPSEKDKNGYRNGRTLGGLIIIAVGSVLLAQQVGADLPYWLFSWKLGLIVLGIYIGVRHNFRSWGWLIPIIIGSAFLVDDLVPEVNMTRLIWPIIIIAAGLAMIFKSRLRKGDDIFREWERRAAQTTNTSEGFFESVTIFGENKKQVLSKDFKGGESVCVFGGIEVNLTQADIQGRVPLELTQVFGGSSLIVPSHWKIESEEMVSIFGGLNDKRQLQNTVTDHSKVLVLRGTSIFGGIDIKSF